MAKSARSSSGGSLGWPVMRMLAACSLGGSGHFRPLVSFLDAARRRGTETLVLGPPALREMVERAGYPFQAGGEPAWPRQPTVVRVERDLVSPVGRPRSTPAAPRSP